ncbi:MAG: TolC family protein [Planctomycetaceae bacterium]|nr:TolC family protein [Planctomycetaceae bacterium]
MDSSCSHHRSPALPSTPSNLCCLVVLTLCTLGCRYTGSVSDYVHNGFKVGPNYRKPAVAVEEDWIDGYDKRLLKELPRNNDWWAVFDDPKLTTLIERSYQQNIPLREAGLRVLESRTELGITVGSMFPQQQEAVGEYSRIQISRSDLTNRPLDMIPRAFNRWSTGFDAAWELDVWGRFRRSIESAEASLDASVEEYDDILVTLLAETAATYVELRAAQERIRLAEANVKAQLGSLGIAESRYNSGTSDELDVFQAKTNVRNTQSLIPEFKKRERKAIIRLCVLQGIPPQNLLPDLGEGPIPGVPNQVTVGIPADLLRRRPDIRRAEREVAAQSARIGVAASDMLPHFAIRGSLNYNSESLSRLLASKSLAGGITPGFSWDLLNYGRLRNQVLLEDAVFQQRALNYQQTVLKASEDVERAIVSFLQDQQRVKLLSEAVAANQQALKIAIDQYRAGDRNYNQIFTLQAFLVEEQDALALARQSLATSLISIYKALGGGWQIRLSDFSEIAFATHELIEAPPEQPQAPPEQPQAPEINLLPPVPPESDPVN